MRLCDIVIVVVVAAMSRPLHEDATSSASSCSSSGSGGSVGGLAGHVTDAMRRCRVGAAGGREGYDYEFSPPADERFVCPVCMMVMRRPVQTTCGHRFCDLCIRHWLRYCLRSLLLAVVPARRGVS